MEFKETKQTLDMAIMIGVQAGETITYALRKFYDTVKYYNLNKGDGFLNRYQEVEGKFFKNEGKFILYNKQNNGSAGDIINVSISNTELKDFTKLCKEYGVDILYMDRPDNLEKLFARSEKGEKLSKNQQEIVDAFTIKDAQGNKKLKDDASLICFNLKDINVMERVLDRLEEKSSISEKEHNKLKIL